MRFQLLIYKFTAPVAICRARMSATLFQWIAIRIYTGLCQKMIRELTEHYLS